MSSDVFSPPTLDYCGLDTGLAHYAQRLAVYERALLPIYAMLKNPDFPTAADFAAWLREELRTEDLPAVVADLTGRADLSWQDGLADNAAYRKSVAGPAPQGGESYSTGPVSRGWWVGGPGHPAAGWIIWDEVLTLLQPLIDGSPGISLAEAHERLKADAAEVQRQLAAQARQLPER